MITRQQHSESIAAAREQVQGAYKAVLENPGQAFVVAVVDATLSDAARQAVAKSVASRGWNDADLTFAKVNSAALPLNAAQLFELVEGLDPLSCIVAGKAACALFAEAYRVPLPACGKTRALGRDVIALEQIESLVETDVGKRAAWSALKQLASR